MESKPEKYVQVYGKGELLPISKVLADYKIPARVDTSKLLYLSLAGNICVLITSDGNLHYTMNYPSGKWRTRQDRMQKLVKTEEYRKERARLDERLNHRHGWNWATGYY